MTPPGYARSAGPAGARVSAGLCSLLLVATLVLAYETLARLPGAYLGPEGGPPRWAAGVASLLGAAAGLWLGRLRLDRVLVAASLVGATSGPLWFWAFAEPRAFSAVAILLPALGAASVLATVRSAARTLPSRLPVQDVLEIALRPSGVGVLCLLLGLAAVGVARIGLIRIGAAAGLVHAAIALAFLRLLAPPDRRVARLALGAVAICLAGLVGAERLVPLRELRRYTTDIVYAEVTDRGRVTVTSAQASFAVFVDGNLKFTTVDERRYYETLVHPAMAAAERRARILVLGSGDGLAEREILRYPEVELVTVVVVDRTLADLSTRLGFLRSRTGLALGSPKVRIVEREPIVWLDETGDVYDVAIVDLLDPLGYAQSKNYTRYFYQKLAAHLAPRGVAMVQATSPFKSPQAFATIRKTIEAADLFTLPCHAPVPLLGDWGFVLASRGPIHVPKTVPPGLSYLDEAALAQAFVLPPDTYPPGPVRASTLHDQPLVDELSR